MNYNTNIKAVFNVVSLSIIVVYLACQDLKPHPDDKYKFILGIQEMMCPNGTYYDHSACACQRKYADHDFPVSYYSSSI